MDSPAAYPRPDFQRQRLNWESLNGLWDFAFDDGDCGQRLRWQQQGIPASQKHAIKVPYAFQTPASGIGLYEPHEVFWYERMITDIRTAEDVRNGHRLLARFGAVDYECSVWVDGRLVGDHLGGHVPFDVDLTEALPPTDAPHTTARLTMRVRDSPYDLTQPRGKQYWKPVPESIFYTPTSGIWQSVWLESVPRLRLGGGSEGTVLRSDDIERGELHAQVAVTGRSPGTKCSVEIEARLAGIPVSKVAKELPNVKELVNLDLNMRTPNAGELQKQGAPYDVHGCWLDGVGLWHPEHPILYDLTLRLYDGAKTLVDEIQTMTGMRKVEWRTGDGCLRLNGKPYFQALVLDQGYWPETGLTPPSPDALKADIEASKNMGFNGCRKHQKVEDPIFLYWADRLGYLVWGEIANAYEFDETYIHRFNSEWTESVRRDINHPCIVTWTPVNESWAYPSLKDNVEQRNHIRSLYFLTKALDPSRPINDNCGWEHVQTDLTTYHDYSDAPELADTCSKMEGGILAPKGGNDMFSNPIHSGSTLLDGGAQHQTGTAVLCTEFGGVSIAPAENTTAGERDWGYTTASDPKDLLERFRKLLMAVVQGGHTCGFVYTQLYDIEQEVNGLQSYARQQKIPASEVKDVVDRAKKYYYDHVAHK